MSFDEVLDLAIKKCENIYGEDWQFFYKIYPFTTENISGYIDYFDLNNKSLLTVGSSSDQIFNAVLKDCKDITLLDINPFAKSYFYLKMAAILELDIYEYMLFLRYKYYPSNFVDNKMVFNTHSFEKIKDTLRVLDYESYLFWDDLFQMFPRDIIRSNLFSYDEGPQSRIIGSNIYLQNNIIYDELKSKIKKIKPEFIQGDIFKINLDKTYDNIWLSNILTYGFSLEDIVKIFNKFNTFLNDDGLLLLSYLYNITRYGKYNDNWEEIYNINKLFDTFNSNNFDIKSFRGIYGIIHDTDRIKDSVLIYKK